MKNFKFVKYYKNILLLITAVLVLNLNFILVWGIRIAPNRYDANDELIISSLDLSTVALNFQPNKKHLKQIPSVNINFKSSEVTSRYLHSKSCVNLNFKFPLPIKPVKMKEAFLSSQFSTDL